MIHDLKRQGLSLSAIARQSGLDRKTVRKYLDNGLEAPAYTSRDPRPCLIDPWLFREIRDLGYGGGYTAVTDFLRDARPPKRPVFERRFETPPGKQTQADFAEFAVEFTDEPGVRGKSGCSLSCWGTAAGFGGGSAPAKTCRPSCAVTSLPSMPWAARRPRFFMIG